MTVWLMEVAPLFQFPASSDFCKDNLLHFQKAWQVQVDTTNVN